MWQQAPDPRGESAGARPADEYLELCRATRSSSRQRIGQFADIVGRERVLAGTDCGFGTFAGIGKMDAEISYAKLAALAEGARRASQRLWS